jgi:hypothetical protein
MPAGHRRVTLSAALALTVMAACTQTRSHEGAGAATQDRATRAGAEGAGASDVRNVAGREVPCPAAPPRLRPAQHRPRYRLSVRVAPGRALVTGRVQVRFTPDRRTDRLVFRLWPNGPRPASAGAELWTGTPTILSRGPGAKRSSTPEPPLGRRLSTTRPNPTTLAVGLDQPLSPGEAVTVRMPWRLEVPSTVADRLARAGDTVRLGSFFPLLAWEAGRGWALDPPTTGFAEASVSPAADFDVRVTVPAGDKVLATGRRVGPSRWRARGVRDFAMAVGRFDVAHATVRAGRPTAVSVGVAQGLGVSPEPFLNRVAGALRDLSRRYGAYPWPTLSLAVLPGLGASGIEYPAMIFQGPQSLNWATVHEVAHQWFYGLVGNNQARDPWLDEGIASWAQARADRALDWYEGHPVPGQARGRLGKPMTFWDPRDRHYFAGVYVAGVQALSALGRPRLVDCALRSYVAANAYRIARPRHAVAELARVLPRAPGVLARLGVRVDE